MKCSVLLAVLALGCGDGSWPPEDCDPPLPATDDDGRPWPTYTEANAQLDACENDAFVLRRGACTDGKTFLEQSGSFTGDTRYFAGEVLVGVRRYSDVVFACDEYRFGDTSCEETTSEELACP
jgi:hypothetical protein